MREMRRKGKKENFLAKLDQARPVILGGRESKKVFFSRATQRGRGKSPSPYRGSIARSAKKKEEGERRGKSKGINSSIPNRAL